MTEVRERRTSGAVSVKRALIGRPRASGEMHDTLLSKKLALPVFASDPLSSVAYATESALVVLVAASASAAHLVLPISAAIARAARDRRPFLPADGARVRDERRSLCGRARQSRPVSEPSRGRRTPRRLHPHGCGLRRSRDPRSHLRSAVPRDAQGRSLAPLRRASDAGQPQRRPRVGTALRVADVRIRGGHVRPRRGRCREVRHRCLPAGARHRSDDRRRRRGDAARRSTGLRVGSLGSHGGRSDLERRQRLQAAEVQERSPDSRRDGADRHLALPRSFLPRRQDRGTPERECLLALRNRACGLSRLIGLFDSLLRRPGDHSGDPRARGEHLVPGLPAPGRRARERPVLSHGSS